MSDFDTVRRVGEVLSVLDFTDPEHMEQDEPLLLKAWTEATEALGRIEAELTQLQDAVQAILNAKADGTLDEHEWYDLRAALTQENNDE